jgi:hypothetical protein
MGIADAVDVRRTYVHIIDYKSGVPKPEHADQLREYALFWERDALLNPTGQTAGELTLMYDRESRNVDVPNALEMHALELALARRAEAADVALSGRPPEATVSSDNCRYCDVKPLCGPFWSPASQETLVAEPGPARSLQVRVGSLRGGHVWEVEIERDVLLPEGAQAIWLTRGLLGVHEGDRLRLINVAVDASEGGHLIRMAATSEVFRIT